MTLEGAAARRFKPLPLAVGVAAAALMAIWWLTEAVPFHWTACLPIALFPALGVFAGGLPAGFAASISPYVEPPA